MFATVARLNRNFYKFLKKAGAFPCLFLFAPTATAQSLDFTTLAMDSVWHNQLQYRENLTGGYTSQADGSAFFLAAKGKESPLAELEATYHKFLNNPEEPWGYAQQPVICAFPTRREFLEKKLNLKFKSVSCPDRDKWKKAFSDSRVYMVFSDSFPNNPASMFGHTFLLFSRAEPVDSGAGLLDYAINFSANTTGAEEKSLFYTIKGLLGGYPGQYQIQPFYQMLNQYVKWDSRDLWYSKLPLDNEQTSRLTDHIWEIFSTTYFDYYFFDENCSYRILAALDYADPQLKLLNRFHYKLPLYYVSPIGTYQAIARSYKLEDEFYSPSIRRSFEAELTGLSPSEEKRFHNILNDHLMIEDESSVRVLDALISYFDYLKRTASANYLPKDVIPALESTLRQRAKIGGISALPVPVERPSSPRQGHPNRAISVGVNNDGGYELAVKAGYHDLLSPSAGYERWSHLNFLDLHLLKDQAAFRLQSFLIADIISFFPLTSFEIKPSWRTVLGFDRSLGAFAQAGVGYSVRSEENLHIGYFFFNPVVAEKNPYQNNDSFYAVLELGVVSEWSSHIKSWITYKDLVNGKSWSVNENREEVSATVNYSLDAENELRARVLRSATTGQTSGYASIIYQRNL